jgi:uncharacterized protein YndB with AHSA1/START domain
MPSAEHRVRIRRPVDEVYRFITSGDNQRAWRPGVVSVALRSGSDGQPGAVYEQRVKGPFGRPVPADYEITSATPGKELRFRAIAGPVRPEGYYVFETDGDGTAVTFGLRCELAGPARLMSPMVAKTMESEVACLNNAKAILER